MYLHPRDEILQAMERIYRYRMTTTSGGNLSIREPNGDVWITPARVDKGGCGATTSSRARPPARSRASAQPSSELPIHQQIRERRPELGGIVHAHPVALVAFSLAHEVPNTRLFHQAWRVCGAVGFAPYELPGSAALGAIVADTFAQGFDCVILENHGVVTAGVSLQEAFRRFETLEFTAKTIIKARLLGGEVRFLTDDELELERPRDSARSRSSPRARRRARRTRSAAGSPSSSAAPTGSGCSSARKAATRRAWTRRRSSSRRIRWTAAWSMSRTWCWCATAARKRASSPAAPRGIHDAIYRAAPRGRRDRQCVSGECHRVQRHRTAARHAAPSRRATSWCARWRGRPSACSSATAANWPR